MTTWRDAARALISRGLPVFPVHSIYNGRCTCGAEMCGDIGKHPLTHRGLNDATLDIAQIDAWVAAVPDINVFNIGVAVPEGIAIIDVDPRHGGWARLNELIADGLVLPEKTVVSISGSQGRHFWFKLPEGRRLPGNFGRSPNDREVYGVDTRQKGQYVVVPPSLHASGNRYSWIPGLAPWDVEIAPLPAYLVGKTRDVDSATARTSGVVDLDEDERRTLSDTERAATVETLRPHYTHGQRHNLAKAFSGWAKQRGWSLASVEDVIVDLTPPHEVANPVQAARDVYRKISKAFGYSEMRDMMGAEAVRKLDTLPNPVWDRELAFRREAAAIGVAALLLPRAPESPTSENPWPAFAFLDPDEEPEPLDFIVKGIGMTWGKPTAIVAYAGMGKSPFATWLALAVATGAPFLGHMTKKVKAILILAEGARLARLRLRRMARASGHVQLRDILDVTKLNNPLGPAALAQLEHVIIARGIGFVVIDTYGSAVDGAADHNAAEFSIPAKALEKISERTRATIVLLLHQKKGTETGLQSIAGHNSIAGAVQEAWTLTPDGEGGTHTLTFSRTLGNIPEPITFSFVDVSDPQGVGGDEKWGLRLEIPRPDAPMLPAAIPGASPDGLHVNTGTSPSARPHPSAYQGAGARGGTRGRVGDPGAAVTAKV